MAVLKLKLLGQLECNLPSGTPLSLSTRKSEVLLAYLALAPGIRHPRDRLINLLWSDRGEDQARNSLRQSLSSIKKAFESEIPDLLQIERTTVRLAVDQIQVDVHEFEQLLNEASLKNLSKAANIYQGEFLEGITIRDTACQEWLGNERGRLRRLIVEVLSSLTQLQLAESQHMETIASAERLVEYDPLQEFSWRLLMTAYHQKGDRNHALMAYKRCLDILDKELGVQPETETIELREQIKQGEVSETVVADIPDKQNSETVEIPSNAVNKNYSIAVLPFDNLSGDPEQEYFSDGITESIILNLSLFPGLQVKSRNSSFAFKAQIKSLGEISKELNVDYVVEGSIRKSGDRIRITVQLIEGASGNQVWGKRYDADLTDLFTLEEELSRSIAATVTGQIESELRRIAIAKGASGQQSYDLLLSGTYHCYRFNHEDTEIAIEKLNQCLVLDPNNVRAHAMLYTCHQMNYLERWTPNHKNSFKLSAEHIRKALELEPENGLVQVFYGDYMGFCGEFDKAMVHLNKALEINPNDPDALTTKALHLELQGKYEAALEMAKRACQLDPYHPWAEWELASTQFATDQYETALETIAKSRTSPGFIRIFAVASNVKLGRIDAARRHLQVFLQECRENMLSMPQTLDEWLAYTRENYPFADPQINRDLIDCLVQAGLEDYLIAEPNETIGGSDHVLSIAVLPFDNLSGDPDQEYFSDGITESIILNLSLFPELNVKSRNSSFAFKQQLKDLGEISRELNVGYLVEGSIRKSTDRIRITVQLIEAATGNQVWGKRYDAEIKNLFDLEEDLSRTIAATVTGQIDSDLQRIAIAKGAVNQDAYDLLLDGIYHHNKITRPDMAIAIGKLNRCLEKNPDNVNAHITLYDCHQINHLERWVHDYQKSFELAGVHASKAFSLDPGIGSVQTCFAEYLIFCRQSSKALEHVNKALQINPNNPDAITTKAFALVMMGEFQQALELAELAQQLDPYHPWVDWNLTECQILSEQYDKALKTISNSNNDSGLLKIYYIVAKIKLNQKESARQALKELVQECRNNMLSMPTTLNDWLQFSMSYTPIEDTRFNEDIIDCLVQAGLEEYLEPQSDNVDSESEETPSIAVLPFENMSGDPEQEYFSDGLSASIILGLGMFNGLTVKSQQTSFAFKNSSRSSQEIAEELKVQYLVEGNIRKFKSQIRVTAQLVESSTGNQIWGKQYESRLEDIFELEQDLSHTIAATISGRIGHKIQQSAARKPAKTPKSYDYLLRGLYYLGKLTSDDLIIASDQFKKCIEIDPENATAHTNLGLVFTVNFYENWSTDRQLPLKLAGAHYEKALELEPDNAFAHAYFAEYLINIKEYDRSNFHIDKSIELNPNAVDGYTTRALILGFTGEHDEAMKNADLCYQLDPYSLGSGWIGGQVYRSSGQYQKAMNRFRSMSHIPASVSGQIAACLAGLGKTDEAKSEMHRYHELAHNQMPSYPKGREEWRSYWSDILPYQSTMDFDAFFDLMLKAGLCD